MSENRIVTKIEGNKVSIRRADWDHLVEETDSNLGLELRDIEPGKGKTVTIRLDVWLFLLSVLKAAVEYSGYVGAGCEACCEEECEGLGGCDFCYGTIGVCEGGDLVFCGT